MLDLLDEICYSVGCLAPLVSSPPAPPLFIVHNLCTRRRRGYSQIVAGPQARLLQNSLPVQQDGDVSPPCRFWRPCCLVPTIDSAKRRELSSGNRLVVGHKVPVVVERKGRVSYARVKYIVSSTCRRLSNPYRNSGFSWCELGVRATSTRTLSPHIEASFDSSTTGSSAPEFDHD